MACASCLGLGETAFAAEPTPASDAAPVFDAGKSGADRAAAAFERAMAAYEARDLKAALAAMRESLRLSGRPELLYNIARLEEELGNCADALSDYREYLERVPQGRYRTEAERASAELSLRCPAAVASASPPPLDSPAPPPAAAAVPAASPPPPAAPPPAHKQPDAPAAGRWPPVALGYGAIGLGVVAGASAIYLRQEAVEARDSFQTSVDAARQGGPRADFGLEDEHHRKETWAWILGVGGGALVAGGIVVVVLAPRENSQAASTTRLHIAPSQLSVTHTF